AVAQATPQQSEGHGRRNLARGLSRHAERRASGAGHSAAAARMDIERMVQPGRGARHCHPVLSCPSPPDETREENDARGRRRHLVRVHGHSPSRGRPCRAARLPVTTPPALATVVRTVLETLPALLPAQSGQPTICSASSALVRAEPSGRGLRRNLCGVVTAAIDLADTLCRLAGAEEARIYRRTDARDCREAAAGHDTGACRSTAAAQANAWRALPENAGVLRFQATEDVRPRSLTSLLR